MRKIFLTILAYAGRYELRNQGSNTRLLAISSGDFRSPICHT
jgi:hypothetical protein